MEQLTAIDHVCAVETVYRIDEGHFPSDLVATSVTTEVSRPSTVDSSGAMVAVRTIPSKVPVDSFVWTPSGGRGLHGLDRV